MENVKLACTFSDFFSTVFSCNTCVCVSTKDFGTRLGFVRSFLFPLLVFSSQSKERDLYVPVFCFN